MMTLKGLSKLSRIMAAFSTVALVTSLSGSTSLAAPKPGETGRDSLKDGLTKKERENSVTWKSLDSAKREKAVIEMAKEMNKAGGDTAALRSASKLTFEMPADGSQLAGAEVMASVIGWKRTFENFDKNGVKLTVTEQRMRSSMEKATGLVAEVLSGLAEGKINVDITITNSNSQGKQAIGKLFAVVRDFPNMEAKEVESYVQLLEAMVTELRSGTGTADALIKNSLLKVSGNNDAVAEQKKKDLLDCKI